MSDFLSLLPNDSKVVVTITSEQPKAVARVEQDCLTPQRRPAVPVAPAAVVDPSFTQERSANAAVTPAGVYDVVLEAALRAGRFGKRRLPLAPQWAWLLGKVAKCHGVAEPYCLLRYLQHVMARARRASPRCCGDAAVLTILNLAVHATAYYNCA